MGPLTAAPVVLLKTSNDSLTHSTNCVAPTAPLVSGGAEFTLNPGNPLPSPSKFRPDVTVVAAVTGPDCTIGSPPLITGPCGCTSRKGLSCKGPFAACPSCIVMTGCETPCSPKLTSGLNC